MTIVREFVRKWIIGRLLIRNPVAFVAIWILARLRRGRRLARNVPLSKIRSRGRVGADFLERRGLVAVGRSPPRGVVDDLDEFARDGSGAFGPKREAFDPGAIDPRVRDVCERTAEYRIVRCVRWRRGVRLLARVLVRIARRIDQLTFPGASGEWQRLHNRFLAVDLPDDPREDVRGWVRTDETGACAALGLYGTYEGDSGGGGESGEVGESKGGGGSGGRTAANDDERFLAVSLPLPGCTLSAVLRPSHGTYSGGGWLRRAIGRFGRDDGGEIVWTTAGGGHPGIYMRLPAFAVRLPASGLVRVVPDRGGEQGDVHADLELRLYGIRFLRVDYRLAR